jgi:hypothetical protein
MLLLQLAGGLVLAVLLPLGTVGLLLAIRSPLSRPGEAAEAVGVPVLGVLWLPRLRRAPRPWSPKGKPTTTDSPSHVPGLQALCQTLFPDGKGSCLLSAPAGEAVMRTVVAGCLVRAMAEYGEVVAVPAVTGEAVGTTERVVVLDRPIEHLPDNAPVVIDGFDNDGITARQEMPDGARGVLIVPEGSPRTGVLDAAEQFADGELAGIVFVRR